MQGVSDVPKSRSILVIVLLADMLNTFFREFVSIIAPDDSQSTAAGIATVFLFILVMVFFLFMVVVVVIYSYSNYDDTEDGYENLVYFHVTALLVEAFGASFYFYGDNINYILRNYGDGLNCGQQCIENNRIAATFTLALSLMFHHLFPPCLSKIASRLEMHQPTQWYSASSMFTTILKVDALFTVVAMMLQTTGCCSKMDQAVSAIFLVICVVVGIIVMIVHGVTSHHSIKDKKSKYKFIVPFSCILLVIIAPIYMLADNHQPLDCAFGCDTFATFASNLECDTFASNQTRNETGCNKVGNSGLRLGLISVPLLTVSILSIVLFSLRDKTKADEDGLDAV